MPSRIAETAENALVRELMVWWRQYNAALFEDCLLYTSDAADE